MEKLNFKNVYKPIVYIKTTIV